MRWGKFSENPFDNPKEDLSFNVQLHFQHTNELGTDIYPDPLHCFAFKTAKHVTPFELNPMVNYQGNLYIEKHGARYEVMRYPYRIDPYGVIHSKTTNSVNSLPNEGENLANTSRPIPEEVRNPKASLLDKLFDNFHVNEDEFSPLWTPVRNVKFFGYPKTIHCKRCLEMHREYSMPQLNSRIFNLWPNKHLRWSSLDLACE